VLEEIFVFVFASLDINFEYYISKFFFVSAKTKKFQKKIPSQDWGFKNGIVFVFFTSAGISLLASWTSAGTAYYTWASP